MSESLSWMQTGTRWRYPEKLDQDVLLPLWEIREGSGEGDYQHRSAVCRAWMRVDWHYCSILSIWRKAGQQCDASGVNDKVYTTASV